MCQLYDWKLWNTEFFQELLQHSVLEMLPQKKAVHYIYATMLALIEQCFQQNSDMSEPKLRRETEIEIEFL